MSKYEYRTLEFRISQQQRLEVLGSLKSLDAVAYRSQLLHDRIFLGEDASSDCFRVRLNRTYWKAMLQRVKSDGNQSKLKTTDVSPGEIHLLNSESMSPKWSGSWFKKQVQKRNLGLAYEVVFERAAVVLGGHSELESSLSIDRISQLITRASAPASISSEFNLKVRFKGSLPGIYKRVIYDHQLHQANHPFVDWRRTQAVPALKSAEDTQHLKESVCLIG